MLRFCFFVLYSNKATYFASQQNTVDDMIAHVEEKLAINAAQRRLERQSEDVIKAINR